MWSCGRAVHRGGDVPGVLGARGARGAQPVRAVRGPELVEAVAGDLLVPPGDRGDLLRADDVLDPVEGPVPGAFPHLADDGVRRGRPVGQDHGRRPGQPLGLVVGERLQRAGAGGQQLGEPVRVEDGLAGAVGPARHHGVGRVAEQGHPAEGPARERVLVHHRVLEHGLGARDERGDVQPVERPVLEDAQEVLQAALPRPVAAGPLRGLELGDPVDELVAVVVDVADGVDHHLAAGEPADPRHARACEEGRRHGRAAPHGDPGVPRLALVRIELPAHRGVDAVTGDDDVRADVGQLGAVAGPGEPGDGAGAVLVHGLAPVVGDHRVLAQALAHGVEEHLLQVAAVDRELRAVVPGVTPRRLGVDDLPDRTPCGCC